MAGRRKLVAGDVIVHKSLGEMTVRMKRRAPEQGLRDLWYCEKDGQQATPSVISERELHLLLNRLTRQPVPSYTFKGDRR